MSIVQDASGRIAVGPRASRHRTDRFFYGGFTVAAIAVVFAGFASQYYLRAFTGAPPVTGVVALHAALFSGWMVLFGIQASLVAAGRTDLHRRLGALGSVFALAVPVVGYLTAVAGARTGWAGPQAPRDAAAALPFLLIPFGDLLLFAGFFGLALYFRRQPETHKRLMVLAVFAGMLPPALGRLPVAIAVVAGVTLLIAGPVYDRWSRGLVHGVYKWGVPVIVASIPLRIAIGGTSAWREFAAWLIQ